MRPRAVLLQGIDVGDTSYWSWEWRHDVAVGGIHAIPLGRLTAALGELEEALPGVGPSERGDIERVRGLVSRASAAVRAQSEKTQGELEQKGVKYEELVGSLRRFAAMNRCLTGALSRPKTESALMRRLSEVLLHRDFAAQLDEMGADAIVELAVLPSQSCARVPWELLTLHEDDTRVLERAIVTTVAPLLTRGEEAAQPRRASSQSPLRVIDPKGGGSVLDARRHGSWAARPGQLRFKEDVDRIWLSEMLPGASHFTYVGHVEMGRDNDRHEPALTALVFGEETADVWGASASAGEKKRRFTAQDALRGTMGYAGTHEKFPRVPAVARDAEGRVVERPGRELWPMPPRVAIIACESGSDYRDVEPFGLVTAFLELGAQFVTATRWVILTDGAFGLYEDGALPLNDAALHIDGLQDSEAHPDPATALTEWKRRRLKDWKRDGKLSDSPITWGAFTLYRAGERA